MNDVLEILKSCDAFLEGHFLLSSGRHSSAYCQMAYLQQYPEKCAAAMKPVAEKLRELDVDVIVGPAMGGIVYASPIPILASAAKLDLPNYAPEECPICKEGKLPLVHLGSRKMKEQARQTL